MLYDLKLVIWLHLLCLYFVKYRSLFEFVATSSFNDTTKEEKKLEIIQYKCDRCYPQIKKNHSEFVYLHRGLKSYEFSIVKQNIMKYGMLPNK